MASTWRDLQLAGWEFVEFNPKKRLNRYRTPLRKGRRKIINEKKDLPAEFKEYAKILFPCSRDGARRIQEEARQQQGQEEDADGGEAGEGEAQQGQDGEVDGAEEEALQGQEGEMGGAEGEEPWGGEDGETEENDGDNEEQQGEEHQELVQGEEWQDKGVFEHDHALEASARKVEKMVREFGSAVINIDQSVEDLTVALSNKPHP